MSNSPHQDARSTEGASEAFKKAHEDGQQRPAEFSPEQGEDQKPGQVDQAHLHPADPRRRSGTDFEAAISAPAQVGGSTGTEEMTDEQVEFLNKLFDMAREGNQLLLEYIRQGIPVEIANHRGDTFLILAAYSGQAELTLALVDRAGADINSLNLSGQSALTCAVFRGDQGLAAELVERGADPQAGAPSALDTARSFEQEHMIPMLEEATHRLN